MNENKKTRGALPDWFAVVWCMMEVGAFILGIVLAITFKNELWMLLSLAAFAMLMGGV